MTSFNVGTNDERQKYRSFWDQFSGRADNSAMMLNANADQIEALDRENILALLPPVNGKFVADIGAGIGRFTTVFAQADASKVVATDFVPSFVDKNRERNAAYANVVEWRVSDATALKFEEGSVDLVFTNWLLMYMSDQEAVQFVANALQWIRPNGHFHMRESCSEPSTKKSDNGNDDNSNTTSNNSTSSSSSSSSSTSLHSKSKPNPTRYRFSSAYIQLLRSIRHTDAESGTQWRFDVRWACSVGVYIERQSNWRQVHWLAKKVRVTAADNNAIDSMSVPKFVGTLGAQFAEQWPAEQREFDQRMDGKMPGWMQKALDKCIDGIELDGDGIVFGFNGRQTIKEFGIDAQSLAKRFDRRIWLVESDPFAYRNALSRANHCADRRVRHAWNANLESALDFWHEAGGHGVPMFAAVVGTEILAQLQDEQILNKLTQLLENGAHLLSVELLEQNNKSHHSMANLNLLHTKFIVDETVQQLENGHPTVLVIRAKHRFTASKCADDGTENSQKRRQLLMGGF